MSGIQVGQASQWARLPARSGLRGLLLLGGSVPRGAALRGLTGEHDVLFLSHCAILLASGGRARGGQG